MLEVPPAPEFFAFSLPIVPGEQALPEASQTPVGPTEHLVLRERGPISMKDFSLVLVLTAIPSRWTEAE